MFKEWIFRSIFDEKSGIFQWLRGKNPGKSLEVLIRFKKNIVEEVVFKFWNMKSFLDLSKKNLAEEAAAKTLKILFPNAVNVLIWYVYNLKNKSILNAFIYK